MRMKERIEIDPCVCGGRPVIRGTRIPVAVVLDQLASGEPWDAILKGFPELAREDLEAAIGFAGAAEGPDSSLSESLKMDPARAETRQPPRVLGLRPRSFPIGS